MRIAAELGGHGRAEDAHRVIVDIDGPSYRDGACRDAAVNLAQAGRFVAAVEIAERCTEGSNRLEVYTAVVRALHRGT